MYIRRWLNRTTLTGMALLLYLLLFNLYIYLLSNSMLSPKQYKLMYNYITAGMLLFSYIDIRTITDCYYHKKFNAAGFSALFANFIFIIFTHLQIIGEPVNIFLAANGLIFVVTLMVLISGGRHEAFNE